MNAKEYLHRVHDVPCVVCRHFGIEQTTPTIAHHLESVRDEDSHYASVALCDDHHRFLHGASRRGFLMRTKLTDIDLMARTVKAVVKDMR